MLVIDVNGNKPPAVPGQASLDELVVRVRDAHAGVISAFATASEKAVVAGQAILEAEDRDLIAHGQKGAFYKRCGLGDRQAERYKKLAKLVAANPTYKSEMIGLSIEEAIKKLSPPKAAIGNPAEPKKTKAAPVRAPATVATATHIEILKVWLRASPAERERAVDSLGIKAWFDAAPKCWKPQIEQLLAEQSQASPIAPIMIQTMPADGSIPEFLRREPLNNVEENNPPGVAENDDDDAAGILDEEDEDEPEPKPKRKIKLIEHQYTIADAVEIALADVRELAEQCREIVDNAPESLQQTDRNQALEQSADTFEDIEEPNISDALREMRMTCVLPKRRYSSRAARASDASTLLNACVTALDPENDDAKALMAQLESIIDAIESCEFPGMYG